MREGGARAGRLEALDGVRGLAILLVVWCHAGGDAVACARPSGLGPVAAALCVPTVFGGTAGVMLFFALSGFLLFLPYARAILDPEPEREALRNWPGMWGFYRRRMRRILPAYYPLFVVLVVVPWLVAALGVHLAPGRLPWGGFLAGTTLFYDLGRGPFGTVTGSDGPLWSLTIEWQFYLLLPVLALGLRWLAGRGNVPARARRLVLGLGMVMVLGLAVRGGAAWAHYALGYADPAGGAPGAAGVAFALLYGIKGKYLEVFATGMLASVIYVAQPRALIGRLAPFAGFAGWLAAGGFVGCGAWALASGFLAADPRAWYWPLDAGSGWAWAVFGQWATGACGAALLLASLVPTRSGSWSWGRAFRLAPLRGLGIISYSLYLWHGPLITAVFGPAPLPPFEAAGRVILGITLAVAFAYASYRLIERPFLAPHGTRGNAAGKESVAPSASSGVGPVGLAAGTGE